MTMTTMNADADHRGAEAAPDLFDDWFDPIEAGLRERVRGFIETMLEAELDVVLARPRYGRHPVERGDDETAGVSGHRHGHRTRALTGTFGAAEIAVPRARLDAGDGRTAEWKSKALRAYQRRTQAADALIASVYLSGTNTRRVRRALAALFGGAIGKDVVSRTCRKVKTDWDAWNARSLTDEPIVRLILDGTAVRVRLDRKATSISLLVIIGVREDGQKVLLAVRNMGWRNGRGLAHRPRRSRRTWPAPARVPHCRLRQGARCGNRRLVGPRSRPALHGSQAQEPARPCA